MFVVLSYDVGKKRVKKVMRTCRRYLNHVHESVFQGKVTDLELAHLKSDLAEVLDTHKDSVRIYELESPRYLYTEDLGRSRDLSNII
ncbi:MAG: CRISPR-associated endonuclease Cas2 [Atopobiaceae bacterium]